MRSNQTKRILMGLLALPACVLFAQPRTSTPTPRPTASIADPNQVAQKSVSVVVLNRFLDPAKFRNATTWQAMHNIYPNVIEWADLKDPKYTPALVNNAIKNAGTVFAAPDLSPGDPAFVAGQSDYVGGSTCYWSPQTEEMPFILQARDSETNTFPNHDPRHPAQERPPSPLTGILEPDCYTPQTKQIVLKISMPNNFIPGQTGAPDFVFLRRRTPDQPAVVQIP